MNLIEQFPDISERIRAKRKIKNVKAGMRINRPARAYYEEKTVIRYHEAAFRTRHLKALFIIAASIGITYYALINSPLFIG